MALTDCELLREYIETYNYKKEYVYTYRNEIQTILKPKSWFVNLEGIFILYDGKKETSDGMSM